MKQYTELLNVFEEGPIVINYWRKEDFKKKSRSFYSRLCKDLGVVDKKITFNVAGDGVSGESTLVAMWNDNNGFYASMSDDTFMYRHIYDKKDYSGQNRFFWGFGDTIGNVSYDEIISELSRFKNQVLPNYI